MAVPSSHRRMLCAIGLLGAAEFRARLPAALLDLPEGSAETLLDTLGDVHLVGWSFVPGLCCAVSVARSFVLRLRYAVSSLS